MSRVGWVSGIALAGLSASAMADDVFDNRFYVAPTFDSALTPNSRNQENAYGGGLALGKSLFPHVAVEILGDYLRYKGLPNKTGSPRVDGPDKEIYGGGGGLNLYLSPTNYGIFLHGDAQYGERFFYNGGAGIDFRVTEWGLGVRLQAMYHKEEDFAAEPLFKFGFRIPLGKRPEPPPPVEPPVEVVPVEAPPPPAPEPPPPPPPCQSPAPGQPISLEGCKTGDTIVLHGVNFEFDKAKLTVNAKTLLDQVADALLARKDIKVEIDGHTDSKGTDAYNQKLSERRSASVVAYLVSRGIDSGRMTSKGFGESMPVADNKTDEGRELNRRVELKVTESGDGPAAAPAAAPADAAATPPADAPAPTTPPADAPPADVSAPPADSTAVTPPATEAQTTSPGVDSQATAPGPATAPADSAAPSVDPQVPPPTPAPPAQ